MPRLFTSIPTIERTRVAAILRTETVGGLLVIAAAAIAIVWANSPAADVYDRICAYVIGPESLHLHLSLEEWAADGLLAIFFFVAGLELKREFVDGDLADVKRAALPVGAAVGGMIVPALLYVLVNLADGGDLAGWAVPTATDIAFAVAVLAVISTHLPSGLRTFLLTLAVVDDLLAITVIALFYTDHLSPGYLLLAVVPVAGFALVVRRGRTTWWLLVPLAAAAWWCVHASGIHATVAGVVLAFTVPVIGTSGTAEDGMTTHLEHVIRPVSAGVAVPLFAFFAAGVGLGGLDGVLDSLTNPLTLGVIAGLVLGKPIGITLATWLLSTFTRAELDEGLAWVDVIGMAMLGGIGFTVSLLIGDLAFDTEAQTDHIKVGVLLGSLTAALLAAVVLRLRNRVYRRIEERENATP